MNQKTVSTTILIAAISVLVTIGVMISIPTAPSTQVSTESPNQDIPDADESISAQMEGTDEIREIASEEELRDIIQARTFQGYGGGVWVSASAGRDVIMFDDAMMQESGSIELGRVQLTSSKEDGGSSYSTTNIQVQNVDEPDYIKNDSKYVYIVSQNTLSIIDAYPAESAELILKIALDVKSQYIENMFLNNDRLVIFYNGDKSEQIIPQYDYIPRNTYKPVTHALIIDISDIENPTIIKDYAIDGHFRDARMIDNYVYFVTNSNLDYQDPRFPIITERSMHVMTPDVFYFDSDAEELSNFNTLTAIDIFGETINSESFLVGYSWTYYVSANNFYLTYQKDTSFGFYEDAARDRFFNVIVPLLPEDLQTKIKEIQDDGSSTNQALQWLEIGKVMQSAYDELGDGQKAALLIKIQRAVEQYDIEIQEKTQRVIIQKIAIDKDDIQHVATGSVPGRLLNQFSMDENQDRFRVATTTEYYTENRGIERANGVYVLDEELDIVGELERIAPNESIFSARFIDDRLYLVTFEQIDPFFVIDLSDDTPKILGELKMPGFSNYLHPYDREHVIGLGRETTLDDNDRVREIGIKIALFNVADVNNPKLVDTVIIGEKNRVDSSATYDHRAFFFDKTREILSIPIEGDAKYLDEISSKKISQNYVHWEGFYVFNLDRTDGFSLKGVITHVNDEDNRYYYGTGGRTFYIDNVLYTVTEGYLKMNSLDDDDNLQEINSIKLKDTGKLLEYVN